MTVSIIIPVYQVALYIEDCLRSVMGQTYTGDMECLLIDDCGTDDSMAIAERLMSAYDGPIRFEVIRHKRNRGLSAARNTGMDAANGDYLYFLDSDDVMTPDCMEKLVSPVLQDSSIEIMMGNYALHAKECKAKGFELPIDKQEEEFASLAAVRDYYFDRRGFYVYAWNKLIRRDFLMKHQLYFKEGMKWEDYLWTFFVVKHLKHMYVLSDPTYIYYKRPHSITTKASRKEKAQHMGQAYAEIANNFTEGESEREARRFIKGFCFCYVEDPGNAVFVEASHRYMDALAGGQGTKEWLLLRTTVTLSKFGLTRRFLQLGARIMERIS